MPYTTKAWFTDKKTYPNYIGVGMVEGTTQTKGKLQMIELHNILYSPDIGGHFVSVLKASQKAFQTTFTGHNALVTKDNNVFLEARIYGNHY